MHSFQEIIGFAIKHEEEEAIFYRKMAELANNHEQKEIMLGHARQEEDHKRRLQAILDNDLLPMNRRHYSNPPLKITDYLSPEDRPTRVMGVQEALLLAAKREKKTQRLYQTLADQATEPEIKDTLHYLAEMEGKHAHALEQEYNSIPLANSDC